MASENPVSAEGSSELGGRQVSLDDYLDPVDGARCEAFAESTDERCRQNAMEPFPYCADHKHLLDDVDLRQMGLKPPKSRS